MEKTPRIVIVKFCFDPELFDPSENVTDEELVDLIMEDIDCEGFNYELQSINIPSVWISDQPTANFTITSDEYKSEDQGDSKEGTP